jgi:peptide/nickel transport system substrate-binding protein
VLSSGQTRPAKAGDLTLTLDANTTRNLKNGLYRLFIAAYSDGIAAVAERSVDLNVGQ